MMENSTTTAMSTGAFGTGSDGSMTAAQLTSDISSIHQNQNIFTERVARALAVRTDTTAMKTALDALSQLQLKQQQLMQQAPTSSTGVSTPNSQLQEVGRIITSSSLSGGGSTIGNTTGNNSSSSSYWNQSTSSSNSSHQIMMIDSRSVRTVMEFDALQQAMAVQESVAELLQTITQLRDHCQAIVNTAQLIRATIHDDAASNVSSSENNGDVENEEYQIATRIQNTIQQRDVIQTQVQTLQLFVQQYNLSDHDVYLLEHYNGFDENVGCTGGSIGSMPTMNSTQDGNDGIAFLRALQRIRKIRLARQEKFGTSTSSSSTSSHSIYAMLGTDTAISHTATTTTALQLMEQLSVQQENAYERLYHWLQQYLQRSSNTSGSGSGSDMAHDDVLSGNYNNQNDFVLYAIQALKYMTAPYYYNHCIELMAAQRRTVVTRTFLIALTVGISDSDSHELQQAPIEMKSYDSVAYIGDMLAFAFKSFTLEADLTKNLLLCQSPFSENEYTDDTVSETDGSDNNSLDESIRKKISSGTDLISEVSDNYEFEPEKALSAVDMLSISMGGIVRPLKSRILQVIATLCRRNDSSEGDDDDDVYDKYSTGDQEDDGSHIRARVGQLYDISGLLLFYYTTILRSVSKLSSHTLTMTSKSLIGTDESDGRTDSPTKAVTSSPLLVCIMECFVEATQGYEATVRVYCAMIDQIAILSGESIAILIQRLLVLLIQVRTNSPGYLDDVTQECPNATCQETLSMEWVSETLVSTCFNIATISIDDIITIKELFQITKRNSNIHYDISRAIQLEAVITQKEKELIDEFIRAETLNVFDLCGLSVIVNGWDRYRKEKAASDANSPPINASTYPGLTSHEIAIGIKEFYTSLYSPPIPSFETTIENPSTRKMVRTTIANAVVSLYADLYTALQNDDSYDDTTRMIFQHTPQEVETLFSV